MDGMDSGSSSVSVLGYRMLKPQGKLSRRLQDLRIPSSTGSRPTLDLSHNESVRLAADSLLSRGLEGYQEVLGTEGEVDFLSEQEKSYILQNGRDCSTDSPGASGDDDSEIDSLSAASQSATRCPAMSTDSDPTVTDVHLSSLRDVKRPDYIFDEPTFEVYFQSDIRAAGMKDQIREFIRKATLTLAVVTDCFSDVELLCDLLEASKKRNLSVHLLLDHLNLNHFLSMWQELKLDSKNFPKLSVCSVEGQTYCAKTGRKLTGQISESFIITDWTEVLTGSYSFSWLSWQVHRSLAILLKGRAVVPFRQEFHRLHSSSKPVPGFVLYIAMPDTFPPYTTLQEAPCKGVDVSKLKSSHAKTVCNGALDEDAQTKAAMQGLSNPMSSHPPNTAGSQRCKKPPLPRPKLGAEPQHTAGGAWVPDGARTSVEPLEKNQNQNQGHSKPGSRHSGPYVQSGPSSLAVYTGEKNVSLQESNSRHTQHRTLCYQPPFKPKSHLQHQNVAAEGLFVQQQNRDRLVVAPGLSAGQSAQRRQWRCSLSFRPKAEHLSDGLSPSTSQPKEATAGLLFPSARPTGHKSGLQTKGSPLGTRRRDQQERFHQPHPHPHPITEAPGSAQKTMCHPKPQLHSGSKFSSPAQENKLHRQPPPGLNWTPQRHAPRPRPVARHSSFDTAYGMGPQEGRRPFHAGLNPPLGRSKSMTDRRSGGFRGARLNPNSSES